MEVKIFAGYSKRTCKNFDKKIDEISVNKGVEMTS